LFNNYVILGRWYEFLGGVGASFILVAEVIMIIDRLLKPDGADYFLLGANYSVEALVYVGNLGLALSVLDGPNVIWPQDRDEQLRK